MANPHVEIPVDPRAGKQAGHGALDTGARLTHRDRLELGIVREQPVECPQKRTPTLRIVLPGVLTVQDDWDNGFAAVGSQREASSGLAEPLDEIARGRVGIPARVCEADQIGKAMVPEQARHLRVAHLHPIRPIQQFRPVQVPGDVAGPRAFRAFAPESARPWPSTGIRLPRRGPPSRRRRSLPRATRLEVRWPNSRS